MSQHTWDEKHTWDEDRKCPCGVRGCMCLPNPQDVDLRPGERIEFGHITDARGPVRNIFERVWIHHEGMSLVSAREPNKRMVKAYWKVLEALLRRTVHLPGQDEETRLWATEKILELPSLFRKATS